MPLHGVYTSSIPIHSGKATTAVIHCSQHDYQAQIDEFVHNELHVPTFYRIAVPGGPEFLQEHGIIPYHRWAGENWLRFLFSHGDLSNVVLIAHTVCA